MKKSLGSGTLTVSGITGGGNPVPPDALKIECTINGGIKCTISWTKD